jgi:NDMA-dependent alcohol dehydrogenase
MKTKAAVLWGPGQEYQIEEIELGDPVAQEVQIRLTATGLCHSDEHIRVGDMPMTASGGFPFIGGHEGAGVVSKVGPGVTSVAEGDHVVLGFIPACGRCPACARGQQNLCDLGASLMTGRSIADGTKRIQVKGQDANPMCLIAAFSPYVTVHEANAIKILPDIPLDKAALVSCGVTTGWGSAVYSAEVRAGNTVVVVGCGGIGQNAIQGARMAGALRIVAVDPVEFKRDFAKTMGATHAYASMAEAMDPVREMTWGRMAESVIITVGRLRGQHIAPAVELTAKGGTTVVTAQGSILDADVKLNLTMLGLMQKRLQGSIFGGANPRFDIPNLLRHYMEGNLKLDELVTRTYRLEEINQGYADMNEGRNIRGLILFDEQDS